MWNGWDRLTAVWGLAGGARDHHATRLANAPEVEPHDQDQGHRHQRGVKGVEDDQGRRPDLGAAPHHPLQPLADPRHIAEHPGADGDGPESELVPRQEIARKVGGQDRGQKAETEHPVETPRTVKTAGEKDPQHVEEDHGNQDIRAPVVDVPNQAAEQELLLETDDRGVRPFRARFIGQHQEHAGEDHQSDQGQRAPAETEGVGEWEGAAANPNRSHVEDEELEDLASTLPFCPWSNRPREDGPPDLGKEARSLGIDILVW